ncbi:MAG: hypothetical protein IKE65_07310 [Clostridia bacterium]|nr:hypothetical protein [Clostridia bacterium]
MFATVNTISEPENFWGKLKYNLLPPPVRAERIQTQEGSGFVKLTVPIIRGKIYWSNVRAAAGDAAGIMLLPGNIHAHREVNLSAFESERFLSLVCVNSFLKLLSLLPQKELLQECAVIDFSASLQEKLKPLPRFARTIKIITARPDKYNGFTRFCMEEYGTAVRVSEHIACAFDAPVVLFAKRAAVPTAFSRNTLVFAGCADNLFTSKLMLPEGVCLPECYLKLLPPGIAPLPFAAALYELSGVASLSNSVCPAFRQGNIILSYKDALEKLS